MMVSIAPARTVMSENIDMEMLRLAIEGSIVQLGMSLSNLIPSN
jgi:hypothetical protein